MTLYNLRCNTCNKIIVAGFKFVQWAQATHEKYHPGHDTVIGVYYPDIKAWDYRDGAAIQSGYLDAKAEEAKRKTIIFDDVSFVFHDEQGKANLAKLRKALEDSRK